MVARRPDDRRRAPPPRRDAGDRARRRRDEGRPRASRPRRARGSSRRPGGPTARAIVAAAAPDEETFNLFEFAVDGSRARQLTHTTGGALWPDVVAGRQDDRVRRLHDRRLRPVLDAVSAATPTAAGAPPPRSRRRAPTRCRRPQRPSASPARADAARAYSPARHAEADVVDAGRRDRRRSGAGRRRRQRRRRARLSRLRRDRDLARRRARTARRRRTRATPDWQLVLPLRPLAADASTSSASSETSFFAGPATDAGTPTPATRRERQIEGGVIFPIRHARVQHAARLSVVRAVADYTLAGRLVHARPHADPRRVADDHRAHLRLLDQPRGRHRRRARRRRSSAAPSDRSPTRRPPPPTCAPTCRASRRITSSPCGSAAARRPATRRSAARSCSAAIPRRRRRRPRQQRVQPAARLRRRTRSPAATSRSPTPSTAGRSRGRSAATARGRSSCTRCTPRCSPTPATRGRARSEPSAIKSSAGAQLSADLVAGFFAPFTVTRRRRVGTRRQRTRRRSRHRLLPRRQSVLDL